MKENQPGGTGVLKRYSDKPKSKMIRDHGTHHSMHRKNGQEGHADKDGKVKYADMGEKFGESMGMPKKDEKHYPSMHVHAEQLPELKDKKVGDEVHLHVKAHIKESRKSDDGKHHFHLEVKKAAVHKGD